RQHGVGKPPPADAAYLVKCGDVGGKVFCVEANVHAREQPAPSIKGGVLDCLCGKRSAELLEFLDRRSLQLARAGENRSAREPEGETMDDVPIAPQACPFGALHGTRQMTL